MDELTRIERQYGCLAEYNRCVQESKEMEYFEAEQRRQFYEDCRRQIEYYKTQGHYAIYDAFCDVEECQSCVNRSTNFYSNEYDDIGVFFCLDENCKHRVTASV